MAIRVHWIRRRKDDILLMVLALVVGLLVGTKRETHAAIAKVLKAEMRRRESCSLWRVDIDPVRSRLRDRARIISPLVEYEPVRKARHFAGGDDDDRSVPWVG